LAKEQATEPKSGMDWPDAQDYQEHNQVPLHPPIDDAVRVPLDYDYSATEIMAALPRSEAVDSSVLPADLRRKAAEHGDDLDDIVESEQLTTRRRRDIAWTAIARVGRVVGPVAKYGTLAAASVAAATMLLYRWQHSGPALIDILGASNPLGLIAIGLGTTAGICRNARRRAIQQPAWVYTDDELATLDAASIDWPAVPEELDRYPNGEVLRREWHSRWMWRIRPGAAALVWREPHLVAVATLIGRDIRSSAAWKSDLFDIHRVRIDMDQTLDDIYLRAHRIWRARANLVPPPTKDPDDVVARRNAEIADAATDAWETLVELMRQLQDYHKQLAPIDAVFAEITALQTSTLRVTDAAVHQLHVDAAGNTLQSDTVNEASAELADLNANLAARLRTLRQSLTTTANGLAIIAP
jgi:hypothetical protein